MRRIVILTLLAVALPLSALDVTIIGNQSGTVTISNMTGTSGLGTIGATVISSRGSELTRWRTTTAAKGRSLGTVSYSTGVLLSGSVVDGATFSNVGSSFDVMGVGAWAKQLTGGSKNPVPLFVGSFTSPISWTLESRSKQQSDYVLSGSIQGTLWNGRMISGSTGQLIYSTSAQIAQGIGHIQSGYTGLGVSSLAPEPGTVSLFGIGLLGLIAILRRKKLA